MFDNLRTSFGTVSQRVNIFVFSNANDFNNFYYEGLPGITGGLTFKIPSYSNNIYVNPWLSGGNGGPATISYSVAQAKEVAGHELGHAFDIINKTLGPLALLPSQFALYNSFLLRDVSTLDFADSAGTVPRLPCAKTPIAGAPGTYYSGGIPFDGVLDLNNGSTPVCSGGVLNPHYIDPVNNPSPSNSNVLLNIEPYLYNPVLGQKWIEVHAQMFGYLTVGNQNVRPMNDKVMDNGYFPCLKSWTAAELTGGALPSSACTLSP